MFSHRLPHVLLIGMVVAAVLSPIAAQAPAPPFELQKLADGVFASIRTEPIGLGVDANNLFIIDDDPQKPGAESAWVRDGAEGCAQ